SFILLLNSDIQAGEPTVPKAIMPNYNLPRTHRQAPPTTHPDSKSPHPTQGAYSNPSPSPDPKFPHPTQSDAGRRSGSAGRRVPSDQTQNQGGSVMKGTKRVNITTHKPTLTPPVTPLGSRCPAGPLRGSARLKTMTLAPAAPPTGTQNPFLLLTSLRIIAQDPLSLQPVTSTHTISYFPLCFPYQDQLASSTWLWLQLPHPLGPRIPFFC
ncbi:WEB family protein chloroplastic, partial [Dissostichus eleginoides]